MRRKLIINWTKPMSLDTFFSDEIRFEKGLYYVSRINGGCETMLYIGKTDNSFLHRINSHIKNRHWWIVRFPDSIQIRLGIITTPVDYSKADLCAVESGLIYEMKPVGNDKQAQMYSYAYTYSDGNEVRLFDIYNEGDCGQLPAKISMYEQE